MRTIRLLKIDPLTIPMSEKLVEVFEQSMLLLVAQCFEHDGSGGGLHDGGS